MLGVKVNNRKAEAARRYLKKHKLLDRGYMVYGKNPFIYFPITRALTTEEKKGLKRNGAVQIESDFEKQGGAKSYREELARRLGRQYNKTTKSFDILGEIAIIDVEKRLSRRVAESILATHKNVKTVLMKEGAVSGRYRKRMYSHVLGARNYIARYRENGATFAFDIRKAFFSPRLAFERKRITDLSKDKENVIVMFAGVGPFAIEIARKNRKSRIIAMELNRYAYGCMRDNIKLNKVHNVKAELGDVKTLVKRHRGFADRIVMPLPMSSHKFIDSALMAAKRACTLHHYTFVQEGTLNKQIASLKSRIKEKGWRFKLIGTRIVRPYSHNTDEFVIDFEVHKLFNN